EPMAARRERRQFPVGKMRREHERRLAVLAHAVDARVAFRGGEDAAGLRLPALVVPQLIETGELARDAAQVVPHANENVLDVGGGFVRKGGGELRAAEAMLRQPRAGGGQQASKKSCEEIRVDAA